MLPNLTVLLIDKNVFLKLKLAEIYPWHINILKEDYQKALKKVISFFLSNPVPFNRQDYQK